MDRSKITKGTNIVVTVEFKDGTSYVLSGAYLVDDAAFSGDDGKLGLKFEGISGDWQ